MEHILTETRTLHTDHGAITLRYGLFSQEADGGITQYGASITNEATGEQAQVAKLTADPDRAALFFERISRGLVTPVTFYEVAEDFVAEI